jgi:hypothetical protein
MSGVYGNMLDAFPELFRQTKVWRAETNSDGSYGEPYDIRTIAVIVLEDAGDSIARRLISGTGGGVLDTNNHDYCFVPSNEAIVQGQFLNHPFDQGVYRFVIQLDYTMPGGFSAWQIEVVQGVSTERKKQLSIDPGVW